MIESLKSTVTIKSRYIKDRRWDVFYRALEILSNVTEEKAKAEDLPVIFNRANLLTSMSNFGFSVRTNSEKVPELSYSGEIKNDMELVVTSDGLNFRLEWQNACQNT